MKTASALCFGDRTRPSLHSTFGRRDHSRQESVHPLPATSHMSARSQVEVVVPPTAAQKALDTAKWARIMTKWLVTHSNKGGVKWKLVDFNGPRGQESKGIVDMIAIRKNHKADGTFARGDLLEIVLIQVKGGAAKAPSETEIARLEEVRKHHNASKVELTVWKRGQSLRCFVLPDIKTHVPPSEIFGVTPKTKPTLAVAMTVVDA
jgi:hypothetical protein